MFQNSKHLLSWPNFIQYFIIVTFNSNNMLKGAKDEEHRHLKSVFSFFFYIETKKEYALTSKNKYYYIECRCYLRGQVLNYIINNYADSCCLQDMVSLEAILEHQTYLIIYLIPTGLLVERNNFLILLDCQTSTYLVICTQAFKSQDTSNI